MSSETAPDGDEWVHELKWDGMRCLAFVSPGEVRLQSSNQLDVTTSFPELDALAELATGVSAAVFDGELVAFEHGRPSFAAMQRRMHVSDPDEAQRRSAVVPVMYVVFDLLHLDGHDTAALPLRDRRRLLEGIMTPGPSWRLSEIHDDPQPLLDVVADHAMEGIVSKRHNSTYQPGRRSTDWVKVKPRHRQEFVVGGYTSGQGNRTGQIGSLLLGWFEAGTLHYAGRAGSGLSELSQQEWQQALTPAESCPFDELPELPRDRSTTWCVPDQVAEIAYGEWPEGGHLRHPVILGRRTDKPASEVTREP